MPKNRTQQYATTHLWYHAARPTTRYTFGLQRVALALAHAAAMSRDEARLLDALAHALRTNFSKDHA